MNRRGVGVCMASVNEVRGQGAKGNCHILTAAVSSLEANHFGSVPQLWRPRPLAMSKLFRYSASTAADAVADGGTKVL